MDIQRDLYSTDVQIPQSFPKIRGLTYVPHFLDDHVQLRILRIVEAMPWQLDLKRRVQHYGYKYDYQSRSIDRSMFVGPLPDFASEIGLRLFRDGHLPEVPDQVIVNKYKPGQGIAAHVDCVPCFGNSIVTISLGSVYVMDFLHVETGEVKSADLELGSALILKDDARYFWKHRIQPRLYDSGRKRGDRISLTFRKVVLDGER